MHYYMYCHLVRQLFESVKPKKYCVFFSLHYNETKNIYIYILFLKHVYRQHRASETFKVGMWDILGQLVDKIDG